MKERNYGIEILRTVSMLMVVLLHVIGHGGLVDAAEPLSSQYWIGWILRILSYCCVNCFALTSGYVMWKSKYKASGLLQLWLRVFFYSILITIMANFVAPEVIEPDSWKFAIFPVTSYRYWYISAYFGMYVFIPILNLVVDKMEKRVLKNIFLAVFFMLCVLPGYFVKDPFTLDDGYTTIWLCILYLVGGYINKYEIDKKIKKYTGLWLYLGAVVANILIKFAWEYALVFVKGEHELEKRLVKYDSPTTIIAGIGLFLFFTRVDVKTWAKKLISFFSATSLSVYLIHNHKYSRLIFVQNKTEGYVNDAPLELLGKVFLMTLVIWIICTLIDVIRIWIFNVLKVRERCRGIDIKYQEYIEKKEAKS